MTLDELIEQLQDMRERLSDGDIEVLVVHQPGYPLQEIISGVWITLHRIFDHDAEFAIGFAFDSDSEAQFEDGRFGAVYFINPVLVVEQGCTRSRSFRKRFKLTERDRLISIAAHATISLGS